MTLYVTQGLPGSGKTTWALRQMTGVTGLVGRTNRDDIRRSFFPDSHDPKGYRFDRKQEQLVTLIQMDAIEHMLSNNMHVIDDNTNMPIQRLAPFQKVADQCGTDIVVVRFDIGIDVANARQFKRPARDFVPYRVIENMSFSANREQWDAAVRVEDGHTFNILGD